VGRVDRSRLARSRSFFALAALLLAPIAPATTFAQAPVEYEVAFPRLDDHEARIVATFTELEDAPLRVRMSRASPGRYALHEFAKNVYDVKAEDGAGRALDLSRPDLHGWDIDGHDGTVRFSYTLYGRRADGTYVDIDARHAHLNAPATFVWAKGLEKRPVRVRFALPEETPWTIATQLPSTSDSKRAFTAKDRDELLDSPIEISRLAIREWTIDWKGATQMFRLAVDHDGSDASVDLYARLAEAVTYEHVGVWDELPAFGHGVYTYIACYRSGIVGDGMEHRNSTILTSSRSLEDDAVGNLGTLSHEVVHAWNVERLRPRSLEPFDFERANPSGELWFAEGFTSYYQDLALVRAGIISIDRYAEELGRIIQRLVASPARRHASAVDASFLAPLFDGARWADPTNRDEIWLSYYTWGAAIALALDLTLRGDLDARDLDLDRYVRALWSEFGRGEIPYTEADLERVLGELARDKEFARSFFDRYIRGSQVPEYARLLERAGLFLRDTTKGRATLGHESFKVDGGLVVEGRLSSGSPLRAAGVRDGDRIVAIGADAVSTEDDLREALSRHRPGEEVELRWSRPGEEAERTAKISLVASPRFELLTYEKAGIALGEKERAFREAWLGPRAKGRYSLPERVCTTCGTRYPFATERCAKDDGELELR